MSTGSPRGRKPNSSRPQVAAADALIALTVWQLMDWGYRLRGAGGVAEVVAKCARRMLKRSDHARFRLGPDRVEQIFKQWLADARYKSGWVRNGEPIFLPRGRPWATTNVEWLRDRGPRGMPLWRVCVRLMGNGGKWPVPAPRRTGDRELTAKGWEAIEGMPRLAEKNGVEK